MGNCWGNSTGSSRWECTVVGDKACKATAREQALTSSERTDDTAPVSPNPASSDSGLQSNRSTSRRTNSLSQIPEGSFRASSIPHLPSDLDFTPSCNTRKSWSVEKVYLMGEEVCG
jgi:hypothetical protein